MKGTNNGGWTNVKEIAEIRNFFEISKTLLEYDLIIQKRMGEYRIKNGLTEQVLRNYKL